MKGTIRPTNETARGMGLAIEWTFIPYSNSRSKDDKFPSMNRRITLTKDDRKILTQEFSSGIGNCPSYAQTWPPNNDQSRARWECENGRHASTKQPIPPDPDLALSSLCSDASALDSASFEDWASDMDQDPDSRKAEAIYRTCLKIAIQLRAALGDDGLKQLREAYQDY